MKPHRAGTRRLPARGRPDSPPSDGRLVLGRAPSLVLALVLLGACGDDATFGTDVPETTSPVTTSPVTTGPANDLAGFPRLEVVVAGEPFVIAAADTPELRARGLMGVTDLVDVDGMLFVFDRDTEAAFWMKDTLIPLDIWFFDAEGALVSMTTMTPCEEDPCERYPADAPYRYALETGVGRIERGSTPRLEF